MWARGGGGGSTAAPCALLSVSDHPLDWWTLPDFRMLAAVLATARRSDKPGVSVLIAVDD